MTPGSTSGTVARSCPTSSSSPSCGGCSPGRTGSSSSPRGWRCWPTSAGCGSSSVCTPIPRCAARTWPGRSGRTSPPPRTPWRCCGTPDGCGHAARAGRCATSWPIPSCTTCCTNSAPPTSRACTTSTSSPAPPPPRTGADRRRPPPRRRRSRSLPSEVAAAPGYLYARASVREGGAVVTTQRTVASSAPHPSTGPDPAAARDPLGLRARARRSALLLVVLVVLTVLSVLLCAGIGPVPLTPATTLAAIGAQLGLAAPSTADPSADAIVWSVRVPRVRLGAAVGACLAISGAALRAMVRNLLADPYILGVSGGASTGAAAAILFGLGAALGEYAQSVLAFLGALGAALIVFLIARAGGRVTSLRLLLSGVAVGYALTAVTNLLIFSSDSAEGSRSVMFWMLGSLSLARWNAFLLIAVLSAILGTVLMLTGARVLDALSAGDEIAHGLGIAPDRARIGFLLLVSLCTAAAVAGAGAIGFVGLVIPHLARRLVGARHRVLVPAAALLGALFLLWADA